MDRNSKSALKRGGYAVALRKESVDRNGDDTRVNLALGAVALRKESVDRNTQLVPITTSDVWSLSARRAWIEIPALRNLHTDVSVALRKESVDRNLGDQILRVFARRRSPQGERG